MEAQGNNVSPCLRRLVAVAHKKEGAINFIQKNIHISSPFEKGDTGGFFAA